MKKFAPPFIAFLVLLAILEGGVALGWINAALVPPPSEVLKTLRDLSADYAGALRETASATFAGFLASAILGLIGALVLSLSVRLREAILPFAIFFQTVPIIAIAPLLVIYFGFGLGTVVASSFIVSVFPVLANVLIGLQSVDPGELELFRLYGAGPARTLFSLRLPRAYPSLYAGLKIAAGLAVIGTVAGEFVAGGGLGAMIDSARTQQRIDIVFGALLLLSLLGLFLVGGLRLANVFVNRWRPFGLHLND